MKNTVLLIIVTLILSACGVASQVTPTAIPPTASFTPSPTRTPGPTATLTPTSTPTPKIGTVYLDPDYDLNDRVKIIEANQEVLWKYTTESFMMLNSYGTDGKGTDSYMKKLAESVGIDFKDKDVLLEYIKDNDIPVEIDGVIFKYLERYHEYRAYFGVKELENKNKYIRLTEFPVQLVTSEEYDKWTRNNLDVIQQLSVVAVGSPVNDDTLVMGGLVPFDTGDHIEFVYIIFNKQPDKTTSYLGIPNSRETVSTRQTEKLSAYLGGIVYVQRLFIEGDDSFLYKIWVSNPTFGLVTYPDDAGSPWIVGTEKYLKFVNQYRSQIPDFPPDFIEPQ